MQILENYVKKRSNETKWDDQKEAYLICLNRLLNQCTIQSQEQADCNQAIGLLIKYRAKYEDFVKIVSAAAAEGAVGPCRFWALYLSSLLSNAKMENHVLFLWGGDEVAHDIVIYRINPAEPWRVLTCGYDPKNQELVSKLTLEQYLLDYIETAPTDTQINLVPKSFGDEVNHLRFYKDKSQKFTPEVMDMYIDDLLTEPGNETALSRYLAFIKAIDSLIYVF